MQAKIRELQFFTLELTLYRALMLHSVDSEHWNTLLHQRADSTAKCHQSIGAKRQKSVHTLSWPACSLFKKNETDTQWPPL